MASRKLILEEDEPVQSRFTRSVKLSSDIKHVNPRDLKPNPINEQLFSTNNVDMEKLRQDIKERGVLVPLVVKKDNTLLAGHTRLTIALELNLPSVPVQYSERDLSTEEERKYVVNDNLLRRHISVEDKISLYKLLYPDFEATFLNPNAPETRGRKPHSDTPSITLEKVAEETGQSLSAIKQQVKRTRDKIVGKPPSTKNNSDNVTIVSNENGTRQNSKQSKNNSDNVTIALPDSEVSQTQKNSFTETISDLPNLQTTLKHIENFYRTSEPDTRKAVENTLIQFMSNLSLIAENKL